MSITLELKPETEARIQAEAATRGQSVAEYLQQEIERLAGSDRGARLLEEWRRAGVLGAWADRDDISDSAVYARELRREAETRGND